MVAIDAANRGALASFRQSVDLVAGRATHQLIPEGQQDLPDELFPQIARLPGVKAAAPVVEQTIRLREAQGEMVRLLGTDLFSERPFRDLGQTATQGRATSDNSDTVQDNDNFDLAAYLVLPGRILLPDRFTRYGITTGTQVTIITGSEDTTATVQGLFRPLQLESGADSLAFMDIAGAQELLGKIGRIDRIDLILDEPTAAAPHTLEASLPPGVRLLRPENRTERVERMVASFQMNLYALSLLAVFVGIFLIYNTLTFAVIQRRRQIGILRCLGLSRAAVSRSFLLESVLLGTLGSLFGLVLGVLLARYTMGAVGRTITEAFAQPLDARALVDLSTMIKGLAVGLGVSILAALLPAWEAGQVQPSAALARPEADRRILRHAPLIALAGLLSLALAYILCIIPTPSPLPGHFGAFFILLGFGLVIPLLAIIAARLLAPPLGRLLGLPVDLGIRAVTASLSRTTPAMVALLVALAMVVGVTLMVQSFRNSLIDWIGQTIRADVYLVPEGRVHRGNEAFLAPELIQRLEQDPTVAAVDTLRRLDTTVNGIPASINAFRFDIRIPGRLTITPLEQGNTESANQQCLTSDAVLVSDVLAQLAGVRLNDTLALPTPSGPRNFLVVGIYRDYSADGGQILMHRDRFQNAWSDQRVNNAALYLHDPSQADQLTDQLRKTLGQEGFSVILRSNASLRQEVVRVFDNTFAITFVMQGLTAAVAFCGILSALLALLLERTRELGTLRALGMTQTNLHRMLRAEAATMGLIASILGSGAGLILSFVLVHIINIRSFGWTITMYVTPGVFVAAFVIALGASLLATVLPARRLAKLPLAQAIREE